MCGFELTRLNNAKFILNMFSKTTIGVREKLLVRWLIEIILMAGLCLFAVTAEGKEPINILKHFKDCDVCPEMISIPAGEFIMGAANDDFDHKSSASDYANEIPRHRMSIKPFGIAKFNITRKQFEIFSKETNFSGQGCSIYNGRYWWKNLDADWEHPGFPQTDNDPVVCISWNDAQLFITWLNSKLPNLKTEKYRLPTEAEWEYAARAGTITSTYWGGNGSQQCKYENTRDISAHNLNPAIPYINCDDGYVETSPVGSFRTNPWGLYDMLGNAYQWMSDCFHYTYSTDPEDFHFTDCSMKMIRGASWATIPAGVHTANRLAYKTNKRDSTVGFRIAVDLTN
jgi:formylglycine-generating enzyme required for sulfatase activity